MGTDLIIGVTIRAETMQSWINQCKQITSPKLINETVKRFTQTGAKVTGVVFNAARPRPGKYGYAYGKYRYSGYAYEQYTRRS